MNASALGGLLLRYYRPHAYAYVGVNAALTLVNVLTGAPWWSLWPLLAWGVPMAFHFFYYKSVTVDERWVDERVEDLRVNSYDFGHIDDIKERVARRDFSVRPADERDDPAPREDRGE